MKDSLRESVQWMVSAIPGHGDAPTRCASMLAYTSGVEEGMSMALRSVILLVLVLTACMTVPAASATCTDSSQAELRSEFDSRFNAWLAARAKWIDEHPYASYLADLPEQQAIVEMGPPVVPFFIDMFDEEISERKWDNRLQADIVGILMRITWKSFPESEWPKGTYGKHKERMELYVKWWREGRKKTPEQFAKLYSAWVKQTREGNTKAAEETFGLLKRMGIEILPLVTKKIEQGEDRLVPFINKLMRQDVLKPNATRKDALDWWKANECKYKFTAIIAAVRAQDVAANGSRTQEAVARQVISPVPWVVEFIGLPREWLEKKTVTSKIEDEMHLSVAVVLARPAGVSIPATAQTRDAAISRIRYVMGKGLFGDKAVELLAFYRLKDASVQFYAAYILGDQWIALKGCIDGTRVTGVRVFYAREKQPDAYKKVFPKLPKDVKREKRKIEAFSGALKDVTPENVKRLDGVILSWGTICFDNPPTAESASDGSAPAKQ